MGSSEEKIVAENASVISSLLEKAKGSLEKVANIPMPEVTVDGVSYKGITFELIYIAKVSIKNPYPQSIPICQFSYILKIGTRTIASGTIPDMGSLVGKDTTVLDVQLEVAFSIAYDFLKDIVYSDRNLLGKSNTGCDVNYQLDIGLTFDIPLIGNITIPISTQGEFKLPLLAETS